MIYDPELGIFLSRDTIPTLNRYTAFRNDPADNIDALGLEAMGSGSGCGSNPMPQMSDEERRRRVLEQLHQAREAAAAKGDIDLQNQIFDNIRQIEFGQGNLQRAQDLAERGLGKRAIESDWGTQILSGAQAGVDFARGTGSALTFDLTDIIRDDIAYSKYGQDVKGIQSPYANIAGQFFGTALQIAITGGLSAEAQAGNLTGKALTALKIYSAIDLGHGVYQTGVSAYTIYQKIADPCQSPGFLDWLQLGLGLYGSVGGLKNFKNLLKLNPSATASGLRGLGSNASGGHTPNPIITQKHIDSLNLPPGARATLDPSISGLGKATTFADGSQLIKIHPNQTIGQFSKTVTHELDHLSFDLAHPNIARIGSSDNAISIISSATGISQYAKEIRAYAAEGANLSGIIKGSFASLETYQKVSLLLPILYGGLGAGGYLYYKRR